MRDPEFLSSPLPGPCPAGEDLRYTGVAALGRLVEARFVPAPADAGSGPPQRAVDDGPFWRRIADQADALFDRTRDLRVAVWLAQAEWHLRGVAGLADGLVLINCLLARQWEALHPQPDLDELAGEPVERINVLAALSPDAAAACPSPVADAWRAVLLGEGFVSREPVPAPAAPGTFAAARAVARALAALGDIRRAFAARGHRPPALHLLTQALRRVAVRAGAADEGPVAGAVPHAAVAAGTGGSQTPEFPLTGGLNANPDFGGASVANGCLASRIEAVESLRRVSAFIRATEPSSPAPLFIDRAVRLLGMRFETIVDELMPEALTRIEQLAGVALRDDAHPAPTEHPSHVR